MMFSSREVLIPLVGSRGGGALCRVAADGHLPPHHPAHLDRSISELLEGGLYQAGQQAKSAVRRLALRGGWLRKPAPVALSIVNPGDVAGLAPDNSASAELGLAVAMLMFITQSPNRTVIASGALEGSGADPDGAVRPVHHLRAKFELVEKHFRQAGVSSPPALFVMPELDPDGTPVQTKYPEHLAALRSMGIEPVPVKSLRVAAAQAMATRLAERPREIWLRRGFAAAFWLLALMGGWVWLQIRTIPMEFLDAALDNGRIVRTPARLHKAGNGREVLLASCTGASGRPEFIARDWLAATIRVGSANDILGKFGRIFYLIVAIYPEIDAPVIKIPEIDSKLAEGVRAGEPSSFKIDLFGQANKDNLLVILARRLRPFDPDRIGRDLHKRLDPIPQSERLSAARNYLFGVAPGFLEYTFQIADRPEECSDE